MTVNMHAILVGLLSVSHTPEQADHAAREVLNQHAHQLAEQQRAGLGDVLERWAGYLHQDTISDVIDLIDPQKSAAGANGEPVCVHCGRPIINKSEPNMGGPPHDNWVHDPGGYAICFPQQGAESPRAEPRSTA